MTTTTENDGQDPWRAKAPLMALRGHPVIQVDELPVWATTNPSPPSPDRHLTSSTYIPLANQLTL
jgi:hypothetical protein